MGLLKLLTQDPAAFIVLAGLLLYSVILHEVAHGWVAKRFGDDTADEAGRLTLRPGPHIDPVGLLMLFLAGFGWARPVPVNYFFLRRSRVAVISVALAGVAVNFGLACLAFSALQIEPVRALRSLALALAVAVKINIGLAAFNLIPIPPLDGSQVVAEFLPAVARARYFQFERYGFFVLILLLFTGILNPVIDFMQGLIGGLVGMIPKAFSA